MFGAAAPRLEPLDAALAERAAAMAAAVRPERLRRDVALLPGPRSRLYAPAAMEQAEGLVMAALREAGWGPQRLPFTLREVPAYLDEGDVKRVGVLPEVSGANLLAVREGARGDEVLLVGAHLDTVRHSPGADDNGAGVAALVELARVLAPLSLPCTVALAVLDLEELGFLGAAHLVAQWARERRVRGAIIFETMAYTARAPYTQLVPPGLPWLYPGQYRRLKAREFRGDWTAVLYRGSSRRLAAALGRGLAHLAGREAVLLLRDPLDLPLTGRVLRRLVPSARHFARSDHVPFWEAGMPALQVTDTANFRNPHYHRPTDTPETLDYGRLAEIVAATALAVAHLA